MDRVLDIDLDFFLNKVSDIRFDGKRLNKHKFHPWGPKAVASFLENRCGLSKKSPVRGRIVSQHSEAFTYWRELIIGQKLKVPFELIRIDAHSDIGVADWGWIYITSELLHKSIESRMYPDDSLLFGLNEANYLAFALACRWIKKLTFVLHPEWEDDLIGVYFKNFDIKSGFIQLKKYSKEELLERGFDAEPLPDNSEPQVPVEFIPLLDFKNDYPITYLTCSRSKDYTPKSADHLIKTLRKFMKKK
ncbi:MAG: UPF0489 family protein [Candidatus Hermodarchaeota archaeon]